MLLVLGRREERVFCQFTASNTQSELWDLAGLTSTSESHKIFLHFIKSLLFMTRIHITSSTRVKGGVGWKTCVPAELKGGKQSRTRVTDAKMANKNEPTSLAGAEKIKTQRQPTIR